jgi:predicted phosphodiesterase
MRCLVLSDIHANLAAFEAVLKDAQRRRLSYDMLWCLGDVVGYGPDPNECIELLRTVPHVCLAGNHDWAVLGKLALSTFHENAMFAVQWTRDCLSAENLNYLRARSACEIQGQYMLAHASPREPIWEYILDVGVAAENFAHVPNGCALVGHTHVPVAFVRDRATGDVRAAAPLIGVAIALDEGFEYIINPGGVGQPRDGDPRAAYALLDTEKHTWTQYRVEYPVRATQAKMRAAGFPEPLIARLGYGR